MEPFPTLQVDRAAIARNYNLLKEKSARGNCAAVVKANAYGLGVTEVAPALWQAGCRHFFVATLDEGIELRQLLKDAVIYVFHGARKGQGKDFIAHTLRPVLNDKTQLAHWNEAGPYALHIDTGMCRLGVSPQEAASIVPTDNLMLVMSHLACGSEPEHPKNAQQLALFKKALQHFPGKEASFANSSGIFLGKDYHFSLARPGCSLYGITPNPALPNPMENVVTLSAPVLQYRTLTQDETVGYGATYTAKAGSVLATVEIGYADGILRGLSNRLHGYAHGIKVPLVGRVSMDMVSIDVSAVPEQKRNAELRITFIGKEQTVDTVADAAGTIGYEIFTRLGSRVRRVYI